MMFLAETHHTRAPPGESPRRTGWLKTVRRPPGGDELGGCKVSAASEEFGRTCQIVRDSADGRASTRTAKEKRPTSDNKRRQKIHRQPGCKLASLCVRTHLMVIIKFTTMWLSGRFKKP